MAEKPAPTPRSLRVEADHATRLAGLTPDKRAKAALLKFADELRWQADELEVRIAPKPDC